MDPAMLRRVEQRRRFDSVEGFAVLVAGLDLASVAVPYGNNCLPRKLGRYSLASLLKGAAYDSDPGGIVHVSADLELPEGFHIDERNAIALIDHKPGIPRIAAVASARIESAGNYMRITQIQGYDRESLGGGLDWRQTLGNAWIAGSRVMELDAVCIQSSENNLYAHTVGGKILLERGETPEQQMADQLADPVGTSLRYVALGREALYPGYDGVADAMHFTRNPRDRDWYLPLQPLE